MRMMRVAAMAAMLLGLASPAMAGFGVRLGTGTSFEDPEGDDITPFAVGLGYKLSIIAVELEVDALYWRNSADKFTESRLALPVIGKFNMPLIPLFFSLDIGAGLEPRFELSADVDGTDVTDDMKSMVLYLPIILGGTLDLQLLSLNLEMRYERQLTASTKVDEDARVHQLMFMAGAFF